MQFLKLHKNGVNWKTIIKICIFNLNKLNKTCTRLILQLNINVILKRTEEN